MKKRTNPAIRWARIYCATAATILEFSASSNAGSPESQEGQSPHIGYVVEPMENALGKIASARLWRIGSHLILAGTVTDGKYYKSPIHIDVEILSPTGQPTAEFAVEDRKKYRSLTQRRRWPLVAANTRFETIIAATPESGSAIRVQLHAGEAANCRLGSVN